MPHSLLDDPGMFRVSQKNRLIEIFLRTQTYMG